MVPDFLKQKKEIQKDQFSLDEKDMLDEALKK